MRQVTSGSERRICSRSRRLKTIDHRSIHQQRMAAPLLDARAHPNTPFDAQICDSPPTSPVDDQIDCKMGTILTISAHRIHNNDERDHNVFMLGQEHGHLLRRAPLGARRYRNRQWEVDTSVPYRQFRCSNKCGMRTRTYCSCSPGVWICTRCHVEHAVEMRGGR